MAVTHAAVSTECRPGSPSDPSQAVCDVAPFQRRADGRPEIPIDPAGLYAFASLIRRCELLLLDLFRRNLLSGTTHTCVGQELCQIAVVRALTDSHDTVFSNHRNHGHFLAFTGDVFGLLAEVMGRAAGVCGGRGGSQHLGASGFHSSGLQGGLTAIGVGQALRRKLQHETGITVVFIGDGTLGEGLLYESLNLAAIWSVPVLFVLEDNGIAQTTPTSLTTAGDSLAARGRAFGLRTWELDDADPDLFTTCEQIVDHVRSSSAPGFLVIRTARLAPHSKGDDTRSAEAIAALHARDPLAQLGRRLAASDKLAIDAANARFLDAVEREAIESAPAHYDTLPRHMFPDHATSPATTRAAALDTTVRSSLNAALRRLLASDPRVVLLGEDLADPYGGAFKVTAGLSTAFPERVVSTPISEAAIVGAGVGLAMAGGRPVVEIMFADFLTLAMDQLLNHAVKFAGIFPDTSVPLVVRTPSGGHRGYGPTHSQSTETLAAAIPGLTVVVPSHRHDPGLLLETTVREWPHPTVFFEHKILYGLSCDPGAYRDAAADPRDPAAALFPTLVNGAGTADVTLVTYGGALPGVEAAVVRLEAEELTVRIIALSLIAPLPSRTLTTLLRDAPLVVVVEESATMHGVGAELGAVLLEAGFRGRFARIGAPPIPIPAARGLERAVLPDDDRIVADVSRLARGLSVVC